MRGVPLSEALKKRGLEAGKNCCLTGNLRKKRTMNKRIRKSDIFGSILNYFTTNHHNVSAAS